MSRQMLVSIVSATRLRALGPVGMPRLRAPNVAVDLRNCWATAVAAPRSFAPGGKVREVRAACVRCNLPAWTIAEDGACLCRTCAAV